MNHRQESKSLRGSASREMEPAALVPWRKEVPWRAVDQKPGFAYFLALLNVPFGGIFFIFLGGRFLSKSKKIHENTGCPNCFSVWEKEQRRL